MAHNLYVLADEMYEHLMYDGNQPVNFVMLGAEVEKRTITVAGSITATSRCSRTATLSSKGQITIPVDVREALGLSAGDRVEFVETAPAASAAAAGGVKPVIQK